jgi:plastocyanin
MRKAVRGLVVGVVAALALACSDEAAPGQQDDEFVNVRIAENAFTPATVRLKVGQSVRWTWAGGEHNVVSGSECTPDGRFKSGAPQAGGSFERQFDTAGTFPYYCENHCSMGMKGEVVVE